MRPCGNGLKIYLNSQRGLGSNYHAIVNCSAFQFFQRAINGKPFSSPRSSTATSAATVALCAVTSPALLPARPPSPQSLQLLLLFSSRARLAGRAVSASVAAAAPLAAAAPPLPSPPEAGSSLGRRRTRSCSSCGCARAGKETLGLIEVTDLCCKASCASSLSSSSSQDCYYLPAARGV